MSEEETIQELSKINRMFASECDYLKNKLKQKENIIKEAREYIDKLLKEEFKITDPFNTDYGKKCQRDYFNSKELETILDILKEKE